MQDLEGVGCANVVERHEDVVQHQWKGALT